MRLSDLPDALNALSGDVIGAAIEVHSLLRPGLLEDAYRDCLAHELRLRGHLVDAEYEMPLVYKGARIERAFRADLVINAALVVELKCVPKLSAEHEAQLLTYPRASGCRLGLLFNFSALRIIDDYRRFAY